MNEQSSKTIAFVLYPGLTPLDIVGPLQAFGMLQVFSPEFPPTVVAADKQAVATDVPLMLAATASFDEVPNPHVLVVPGGTAGTLRAMGDERLISYIRRAAETAEVVGSVCTGSLLLGAAGLLEGRRATTHWAFYRLIEKLGATYVPDRWVEDGKFIMSAGVSAGLDMSLMLIARLAGEGLARQVQLLLEYDPEPPFGGIDWTKVDRDMLAPAVSGFVAEGLKDHPDMLAKLTT
jgi:transcriptional regulator GlxA family with amidase domain